ncbi:hypothetical protein [Chryseolinea sp. H1M3-3]|uniref:hypothetical protein n=1 Tax=Chryseolinea sp. H1M3-3 TaxID=3034144 RepID=UPI0023EB2589|nr:hypothetical protein [Chryseolinea sp. H1M3-3]
MIKLTIFLTLGLFTVCYAQTRQIKAKGIYKEIDVEKHNGIVEILKGGNVISKDKMIDSVLNNPNYYNPPVVFALSNELFKRGRKREAAYWFYVAQLRARYDANLCLDNTAEQATSILTDIYGTEINKFALENIDSLRATVNKVVEFVRTNDEHYDHRWINLHGMDAAQNKKTKELSHPKSKWTEIKARTIDDYYQRFLEAVKSMK